VTLEAGAGASSAVGRQVAEPTHRLATADDQETCATIWREALNDYMGRLNLPEIPDDLAAILRLYRHLQAGDPTGFVVAEVSDPPPDGDDAARILGFASAIRRDELWFLSMLFIRPAAQGEGIGRGLLRRIMPAGPRADGGSGFAATCTDSAQPISNGLYASLGIVPRLPLVRLVGLPDRLSELQPLPGDVRAIRFDEIAARGGERLSGAALDDEIAVLDRGALGVEHRTDHDFIRAEGRTGFLYVDGGGRAVAHGYASEAGRVGPVAVADADLLPAVLAHLVTEIEPRGEFGIWLAGAGSAMPGLLRAGFRIDGFPCLVCWDTPFAAFDRYVPISPGLL
jgi:GNAT superfamily N-acetyltransferase